MKTQGGQWLTQEIKEGNFSHLEQNVLWNRASQFYAQQASGTPTFILTNPKPWSTFIGVELPTLQANPAVTLPALPPLPSAQQFETMLQTAH